MTKKINYFGVLLLLTTVLVVLSFAVPAQALVIPVDCFPGPCPPSVKITSGPANPTNSTTADFTMSKSSELYPGTGDDVQLYCSLDGASWSECTSEVIYTGLPEQAHRFEVYGKDLSNGLSDDPHVWDWTIDTTAPTVSSPSPADQTTDASVDTNVSATFSEDIAASSLTNTSFTLTKDGSSVVAAHVSYDSASKKAILNPDSALEVNMTYTAKITTSVKDKVGNALAQDYTWSFTTAPDTTAPTVSSVTPTDGATNVAANTDVTATFSEDMDSSSITNQSFTLSKKSGSPVSGQVTYDSNSMRATLNPDADLEAGATYDAKIATLAKDLAGNALTQEKAWSFTTAAAPPPPPPPPPADTAPTVVSYTPTATSGVSRSTHPTATFSVDMDQPTLIASNIKFQVWSKKKKKWIGVSHTISYDSGAKQATINPGSTLGSSKKYRVTVTPNVKSQDGLALDQDPSKDGNQSKTWTFTTAQ